MTAAPPNRSDRDPADERALVNRWLNGVAVGAHAQGVEELMPS